MAGEVSLLLKVLGPKGHHHNETVAMANKLDWIEIFEDANYPAILDMTPIPFTFTGTGTGERERERERERRIRGEHY